MTTVTLGDKEIIPKNVFGKRELKSIQTSLIIPKDSAIPGFPIKYNGEIPTFFIVGDSVEEIKKEMCRMIDELFRIKDGKPVFDLY